MSHAPSTDQHRSPFGYPRRRTAGRRGDTGATVAGTVAICVVVAVAGGGALRLARQSRDGGDGDTPGLATVVEIIDGDTLVVEIDGREEHVRLIGIDTPETVARDRPVECFGAEASDNLAALVPPGTPVHLERDIEARDRYDRLLAYVHRAGDSLFVNRAQVAGGFAEASEFPPNTAHAPDLAQDERDARTAGNGLWAACGSADVPIGPPVGGGD